MNRRGKKALRSVESIWKDTMNNGKHSMKSVKPIWKDIMESAGFLLLLSLILALIFKHYFIL
jgi:hypothetical protein